MDCKPGSRSRVDQRGNSGGNCSSSFRKRSTVRGRCRSRRLARLSRARVRARRPSSRDRAPDRPPNARRAARRGRTSCDRRRRCENSTSSSAPMKRTACSPTTLPPRDHRKADRAGHARAGLALASVDGQLGELAAARRGDALTRARAPCPTARRPCADGASRRSRRRSRRRAPWRRGATSSMKTLTPTLMLRA